MSITALVRYDLRPGEYVIFVKTYNVMRGWVKDFESCFSHANPDHRQRSQSVPMKARKFD